MTHENLSIRGFGTDLIVYRAKTLAKDGSFDPLLAAAESIYSILADGQHIWATVQAPSSAERPWQPS